MPTRHDFDAASLYADWMAAAEFALVNNQRYELGGEDPVHGIDCSGLALYILSRAGFSTANYYGTLSNPFNPAGDARLLAPEIIRLLFKRPENWEPRNANVLMRTSGPTGPDPRFGDFGRLFRAYYYNAVPEDDHIVLGFGREFAIESTSYYWGAEYEIESYREASFSAAIPPVITIGTNGGVTKAAKRNGVRVRHASQYIGGVDGYTQSMYLDYDAYNKWFRGPHGNMR